MRYHKLIISVFSIILTLLLTTRFLYAAGVPQMIPYSGTISVNGVTFNGEGQFKFAIVKQGCEDTDVVTACTSIWTNDNSKTDGTEPTNYVTLTVNNGSFSIKLGDTSLKNKPADTAMLPILDTVFSNDLTYLRIWFNDGVTGFQMLSPDKQLVSVPYAYRAVTADNVGTNQISDGSITTAKIAEGAVTSAKIAAGAVGATQIADGNVSTADLAFDPATQTELDTHKVSGDHDSRYPAKAELSTAGTINTSTNPVDWTKLKSVPAGFADGNDDTGGTASDVVCTGCIVSTDIADNAVTTAKIAPGAVGSTQIIDDSITSTDILDGTITGTDIFDGSITGTDILDGSIQAVDIGNLPAGDADYIQNLSNQSQTASLWISGNMRAEGMMRLGSESGTGEGPSYPATSSGILTRRVNTNVNIKGTVVATTGSLRLERDGTNGGFQASGLIGEGCSGACLRAQCMGINDTGNFIGKNVTVLTDGSVVQIYSDLENMVYIRCALGNPWGLVGATHQTVIELQRWTTGDGRWLGFLTSTFNQ